MMVSETKALRQSERNISSIKEVVLAPSSTASQRSSQRHLWLAARSSRKEKLIPLHRKLQHVTAYAST